MKYPLKLMLQHEYTGPVVAQAGPTQHGLWAKKA